MKTILVLALSIASTVFASEKSYNGYETMDMNQFSDLNKAVQNSGMKFKASCTNQYGDRIASTDSRFTDCMNESVVRARHINNTGKNQVPGTQQGITYGTEL